MKVPTSTFDNNLLYSHEAISLEQTKKVSLLKRVDSKYLTNRKILPDLLQKLNNTYYIVEIDQKRILPYYTVYFDTNDLYYYQNHHNGRLNRYKFRSRKYIEGGQVFNEVKHKINKGKTFKSRIERSVLTFDFDKKFKQFAQEKCIDIKDALYPSLHVRYNRITLVDKEFSERMTIDTDLNVISHSGINHHFDNLVIVELKRDQGKAKSYGATTLRNLRCKQTGFSKYCIGIAKTHTTIKKNNFKEKIRLVEKLCA